MKKIIGLGYAWKCDSFDSDARIIDEGYEVLYDDDSREFISTGSKWDEPQLKCERANEKEVRNFYNRKGYLFKGDVVEIFKGKKMLGEVKTINGFWRYVVPNTYGKRTIDYIFFTDGTKVNMQYVKVVGCEYFDNVTYRYNAHQYNPMLSIGGRM